MSKKMLYKLFGVLILASLVLSACAAPAAPAAEEAAPAVEEAAPAVEEAAPVVEEVAEGKLVGISMPTKTSTRWISDGESMVAVFEEMGYDTDLQFADDDIPNQLAQIENMITKGADVLVIAAIDGTTLSDVLQQAADAAVFS